MVTRVQKSTHDRQSISRAPQTVVNPVTMDLNSKNYNMELAKSSISWLVIIVCGLLLIYVVYWILKKIYLLFAGEPEVKPQITNNSVPIDPASRDDLVKAVVKALQPIYNDVFENERTARQNAQRDASSERQKRVMLEEEVKRIKCGAEPTIDPLD